MSGSSFQPRQQAGRTDSGSKLPSVHGPAGCYAMKGGATCPMLRTSQVHWGLGEHQPIHPARHASEVEWQGGGFDSWHGFAPASVPSHTALSRRFSLEIRRKEPAKMSVGRQS